MHFFDHLTQPNELVVFVTAVVVLTREGVGVLIISKIIAITYFLVVLEPTRP